MRTRTKVVLAEENYSRPRKHRVNPEHLGEMVAKEAFMSDRWVFNVFSGYDLAEDGPRSDETVEFALVVASPVGLSVVVVGRGPKYSSQPNAADVCVFGAGDLWRKRNSEAQTLLKSLHATHWSEMETLGAMAD